MSEYRTPHEFHRRRPGEPVGYVPQVGDRIRYALRHTRWNSAQDRWADGHDEQEPWHEVVTVIGVVERRSRRIADITCRTAGGVVTWIDLDWWICERVVEDGALW